MLQDGFDTKVYRNADDGTPLYNPETPRYSVLGASLELERLFPDMSKEEISRAAVPLAQKFWEMYQKGKKEE